MSPIVRRYEWVRVLTLPVDDSPAEKYQGRLLAANDAGIRVHVEYEYDSLSRETKVDPPLSMVFPWSRIWDLTIPADPDDDEPDDDEEDA